MFHTTVLSASLSSHPLQRRLSVVCPRSVATRNPVGVRELAAHIRGLMRVKLGPIYDALDAGEYRQALKLIRNAENRFGEDAILLALKAMALVRGDRIEQSYDVCERFLALSPTEPAVLETMLVVFRDLQRLDWNARAYELACKQNPNDETLLIGLHFAHLRQWKLLPMQQAAMTLFRLFGTERYAQWAALSIELQNGALTRESILAGPGDIQPASSGHARLLGLAAALLSRHDAGKPMPMERVRMYVRVQWRQGDYKAAIQTLTGPTGSLWRDDDPDRLLILARSLLRAGDPAECIKVVQRLVQDHSQDDMRYLDLLVDAHVALGTAQDARAFLIALQEQDTRKRGPFIAEMRLVHTTKMGPVAHLVVAYFRRFSTTRCFIDDVAPYVTREVLNGVQEMMNKLQDDKGGNAEKRVRQRASFEMVARSAGSLASLPAELLRQKAVSLFNGFVTAVNAGTSLEPSEFRPGDDLCLLCAHALVDLHEHTGDPSYVLDAIGVLEHGLTLSSSNFHFRLLLIRLYSHPAIGAFATAFAHYAALDVKSVQLDTLSHLVMSDALRYGFVSHARSVADDIVEFYDQYCIDAADLVILAYRCEHLDQAMDFIQFQHRLRHSFRLAMAHRYRALVHLLMVGDITPKACKRQPDLDPPPVNSADLFVNDDHSLIMSRGPPAARSASLNKPAPFPMASSWKVAPEDSNWHLAELALLDCSLSFLTARVDRSTLRALSDSIAQLGLEDDRDGDDALAMEHWRLCFLILELACCIAESWSASKDALGKSTVVQQDQDDNTVRWKAVQRQLQLCQVALDAHVDRLLKDIDGTLPGIVSFSMFAARFVTLFAEVWAGQIPPKRSLSSHNAGIVQAIVETRVVLRDFIAKASSSLARTRDACAKYDSNNVVIPPSTINEFETAARCKSIQSISSSRRLSVQSCRDAFDKCCKSLARMTTASET